MTYQQESKRQHVRHVWMNARQDERHASGEAWEHHLYEFMRALGELKRLPHWLGLARTGQLPVVHQQCSQSSPEPIAANRLFCALGVNVQECAILSSLRATFAEMGKQKYYASLTPEDQDQTAAEVCVWHIFMATLSEPKPDTSEGYLQDESDRMYWQTVYRHLSTSDEDRLPNPEQALADLAQTNWQSLTDLFSGKRPPRPAEG